MQLLIILLCVAVSCLWLRGGDDDYKQHKREKRSAHDHAQLIRLQERVSALEAILLDREQKLR